jgi:hypothetical protein
VIIAESTTGCGDCGDEPRHPGSVVRLVGKDSSGRCGIRRNNEAKGPVVPQLKAKGKGRKR